MAGVPTACTSLNSLIANVNKVPVTPYTATAATSSVTTTETTYNINYHSGSNWIGTTSTQKASGNGIVGCYFTNGSAKGLYSVLTTLHIQRTGNVGALYGYFVPMPVASSYYVAKAATTTKTSIRPYDCDAMTIRGMTDLTNAVGSCHCVFTGTVFINVTVTRRRSS